MKKMFLSACIAAAGCGLLFAAPRAYARDGFVGALEAVPTGGIHAVMEQKVALSDTKPAGITREPIYGFKPQYGTITLGNAKNSQIVVALDTDGATTRPKLYVDANGNGDLTDDAPVMLTPSKAASASAVKGEGAPMEPNGLSAVVPVTARYDVAGRGGAVPSSLVFTVRGSELMYNREYGRTGTLNINGHAYRVALVDQAVNGKFNDFQHDASDPARVTLLIDKNNDGRFDTKTEAFDAAKPFRLAGTSYEVTQIDARGLSLAVRKSSRRVSAIAPSDMKVGTDVIDFEAQTIDGRTVRFPDDYGGKIVLLNFWATWDPGSAQEMSNLAAAYNLLHSRGLEILSVSLDQANQQQAVQQYIMQAGMRWAQIYDGGYMKAEVAQMYDVRALSYSILVDGSTGKILAMGDDLRGASLQRSLIIAMRRKR